jgi:hypothetical protein
VVGQIGRGQRIREEVAPSDDRVAPAAEGLLEEDLRGGEAIGAAADTSGTT